MEVISSGKTEAEASEGYDADELLTTMGLLLLLLLLVRFFIESNGIEFLRVVTFVVVAVAEMRQVIK